MKILENAIKYCSLRAREDKNAVPYNKYNEFGYLNAAQLLSYFLEITKGN